MTSDDASAYPSQCLMSMRMQIIIIVHRRIRTRHLIASPHLVLTRHINIVLDVNGETL